MKEVISLRKNINKIVLPKEQGSIKKVCLLSDHHISVNPRLWKEAFFYEKLGMNVVILTMWHSEGLLQKDMEILKGHAIAYKSYLDMVPDKKRTTVRFFYRLRKRIAGELQKRFSISTRWAISYAPRLLHAAALKENADLYGAHLECAFWAGRKLIQSGRQVAFDFEDWYSHDYLVAARPVTLLEKLEKYALQNGFFCTTTSLAMAEALKKCYNIDKEITVIYNGFSSAETGINDNQNDNKRLIKILWFSRTIGKGRGIEKFLGALKAYQHPVELHLLGNMQEGYITYLNSIFPINRHTLKIHSFMPHANLSSFIAGFTVGLAVEEDINDNKSLTISNKIIQYIQAGIPVLASCTQGQEEIARFFPSSVKTVDINNPVEITTVLDLLINTTFDKESQKQKFNAFFSWEAQELKLEKLLKNIYAQ